MTTAIALETSKGEFAFGLALGLILMAVALVINLFLNVLGACRT
jgi:tungstate transport system permease protein